MGIAEINKCEISYEIVKKHNNNNKFGVAPIQFSSDDNLYVEQLLVMKDTVLDFYFSDINGTNFDNFIGCRLLTDKNECTNKFKFLIEYAIKSVIEPLGFYDAFVELIVENKVVRNNADSEWHTDGNEVIRKCLSGKIPKDLCGKASDQRFVVPLIGNGTMIYGEVISDIEQADNWDRVIEDKDGIDSFDRKNIVIPHYGQIGYFFLDNNLKEGMFHRAPDLQGDRILLSITPIDIELKDLVEM